MIGKESAVSRSGKLNKVDHIGNENYSTVTLFARFRGLSMFRPNPAAV